MIIDENYIHVHLKTYKKRALSASFWSFFLASISACSVLNRSLNDAAICKSIHIITRKHLLHIIWYTEYVDKN